ncbi:MAG: hypothetical protein LRY73_02485 [Bacillus sp. (in: Bacteria)]|nr:hypothetical protein [Bacillus sp. (in: firmicutes)]
MVSIKKVGVVLLLLSLLFLPTACFGKKQVVIEDGFVPITGTGNSGGSPEEVLTDRFGEELGSMMLKDGQFWIDLPNEGKLELMEEILFHSSMEPQMTFWGLEHLYDDRELALAFFQFYVDEIDSFYSYFGPSQQFLNALESVGPIEPEDFKR